ncbi:unnamed protein product [Peronospora belbahrii]|uniref:UDP-N-acetylglucosamine diphosphorylase n=1 Tax=Peronospora belbahrii TaxID=622444 RepID=A0AAU9KWQ9_9STRA|nr:unnamed protein product [Peronospora belbahrii]
MAGRRIFRRSYESSRSNTHNHFETIAMPYVPKELALKLRAADQGHVLMFDDADNLSPLEAREFAKELEALDLEFLQTIFQASTQGTIAETRTIEPLRSYDRLEQCSIQDKQHWLNLGLESISRGQVAALVLKKSLFQLFAERIVALQVLAGDKFSTRLRQEIQIPFYVMTSRMNHDTTIEFFKKHKFFGLKESQMFFFPQGILPCFTMDGKLILENAHKLATAPDGNGGIYKAMKSSGALARLQACGVKYLHVFSVDNALCKVADPTFIGYCIDKQADCGNKVVWKAQPDERVGVVAKRNDRFCVIEYSEIDREMSERVDPRTGKLAFWIGQYLQSLFHNVRSCRDNS